MANKRLEKVNSVAIIEDSGGFSGIIVAAHEVGHLLGCVHDGSPPPSYLGGPGATHCPWEDGFIMSDLRHTERGFRWSQCSVEQFKHFLNGETATCLYNYPHESQMLHRLLPGTMLSLDEQCKRDRGTNACFKDARVCAQLFCFDSASGYCVSYRPAAEGSPCGEGQICRNGKCVGEIENIIPDYTHQSQTIVARRPTLGPGLAHGRIADNGLSASSTSTATSSPDSRLPNSSPIVATSAQLTSRMDTFAIDPQQPDSVALAPQRTSSSPSYPSSTSGGSSFKLNSNGNAHFSQSKSKPYVDQYGIGKEQQGVYHKYQLRSGYQAAAMAEPGANSQVLGQQKAHTGAMYTSGQQQPLSSSTVNNHNHNHNHHHHHHNNSNQNQLQHSSALRNYNHHGMQMSASSVSKYQQPGSWQTGIQLVASSTPSINSGPKASTTSMTVTTSNHNKVTSGSNLFSLSHADSPAAIQQLGGLTRVGSSHLQAQSDGQPQTFKYQHHQSASSLVGQPQSSSSTSGAVTTITRTGTSGRYQQILQDQTDRSLRTYSGGTPIAVHL